MNSYKIYGCSMVVTTALSMALVSEVQAAVPGQLEEIVVTAQKREQSLQDVPASIEAFSSQQIEQAGWRDISQLQQAVPALEIGGESKARPFVSIRGIGTRKFDIGSDGAVGLFVDEVFSARFNTMMSDTMDLERIEVLKGPQGTLYGRNTIGGAINIHTRLPADELEGRVKVTAGNQGLYEAAGSISGALVEDVLLGRISASTSDLDGVQEDTVSGDTNNEELNSARASLVYRPAENWDFTLIADYSKVESEASLTDPLPGDVFGVVLVSPADPRVPAVVAEGEKDRYSNAFSKSGFVDQEALQLAIKAKRSGVNADLLSITSFNSEDYTESRDMDGTILEPWDQDIDQDSSQFSQEFRWSSVPGGAASWGDRLSWVFGLYYFRDDADRIDRFSSSSDSVLYFPPLAGAPDVTTYDVSLETTSYAAYGQATYALTEALNVTIGLRTTKDKKDFTYSAESLTPLPPVPSPFSVQDDPDWQSTDPKLSLDYHINDGTMVYATYSEGFKSGGVQYAVGNPEIAAESFDPEKLTNYELGLKSRFWDKRLQLNASAFWYEYKDQQVQSIILVNGAPTGFTENAAESNIQGVELETVALLTDSLTIDLKYAYLDAKFDEFVTDNGDFSGNSMPAAPEHAVSAGIQHVTDFDGYGAVTLSAMYSWREEQYFNFANSQEAFQESYGLLNLAAWWDLADEKTRLRVFCENCADEEYLINYTAFPVVFGGGRRTWGRGRLYGVELSYQF